MSFISDTAQIVGGDRDGEIVTVVGSRMREPVPVRTAYVPYSPGNLPPPSETVITARTYTLYRWSDRSGVTRGLRYVLDDIADNMVPRGFSGEC